MTFWYIGHRGAMALEPENTLRSFRRAEADGADVIELDLRASADGVVVVMHDASVDRTTDGTGRVADLSLAELRRLDAGHGEHVPTFDEVVDGTGALIQAEIKDSSVIAPLAELLNGRTDLQRRIMPTSFDDLTIATVADRMPGVLCGWISSDPTEQKLRHALEIGARRVLFGWPGTGPEIISRPHELGLLFNVRPGETVDDIRRALAWGADGITTNDPSLRREAEAG